MQHIASTHLHILYHKLSVLVGRGGGREGGRQGEGGRERGREGGREGRREGEGVRKEE